MSLLERQVVEVDGCPRRRCVLVGSREQQQVLDQALHPVLFGEHHVGELLGGHPIRMGQRDLGVVPDGGER